MLRVDGRSDDLGARPNPRDADRAVRALLILLNRPLRRDRVAGAEHERADAGVPNPPTSADEEPGHDRQTARMG